MNSLTGLYKQHMATLLKNASTVLEKTHYQRILLHSGVPFVYFADDKEAPFCSTGHFAHWCPLQGPHHVISLEQGKKPRLVRYFPDDYWYEQTPLGDPFWKNEFDVVEVNSLEGVWESLGDIKNSAFIGPESGALKKDNLFINPDSVTFALDWFRSFKTDYEVACLSEASQLGAVGHKAAEAAFLTGASELEIHHAYVRAVGVSDDELPYHSIVALNEKGATLHYENRRKNRDGNVLLIDAGAKVLGYGSDITRTYARESAHPIFRDLLVGMKKIQNDLCAMAKPGSSFFDLHHAAHVGIANLLREAGILKVTEDEAVSQGHTRVFFPHGIGHMLGIYVHDVAGKQKDMEGASFTPRPEHPYLRSLRELEPGVVLTIEPGLYFIPLLLNKSRQQDNASDFCWKLIDELIPCGGIRIEDNIHITARGSKNLTREFLPL